MPTPDGDTLAALAARVAACRICVDAPVGAPLPHAPRPVVRVSTQARILIAGQAPGVRVHHSGVPFDDPSGVRLRQWLGVMPDEFYDATKFAILPMGFCFPGYDRHGADLPPRRECAPAWRADLIALMPRVDLVLAVGQYAQRWHLRRAGRTSLGATVADWRAILADGAQPAVLPLPHPSWRNSGWLRRNPWFDSDLVPALREEIRRRID